jgi:nitroimidazol reductase NimA-like FMN-containing flavoprotein (pyridoxamine 5'-phosphate oxidase superfamily)
MSPDAQPRNDDDADAGGVVELSESECWGLLREAPYGRLAVAINNRPDVFPVNHLVDGNTLVFRSAAGTKLAAAVLGRAVAFEVDGHEGRDAWSVVVKGSARLVERLEEYLDAEQLPIEPWFGGSKPNIVRIEVDEVSGRRFHPQIGGSPG